jgi:hypothetical protein
VEEGSPRATIIGSNFAEDKWDARVDQENEKALRIKNMMRAKSHDMGATESAKYGVANFLFLCVLLGIEMDMCGMLCSLKTYWDYEVVVLRVFLFFNMFAFIAPLVMTMFDEDDSNPPPSQSGHSHQRAPRPGSHNLINIMLSQMKAINPFATGFKIYHFCPGIRFYLLVKQNTNQSDVTGVLKVNTLSSFTLGIYQLIGIGYTIWMDLEMNIFVKFNMVSQCLNWTITILYFATPMARWMGNAAQVRQIRDFYQGIRNEWSAMLARGAGGLSSMEAEQRNTDEKRRFKHMLSVALASGFLGDAPGNEEQKETLMQDLRIMRDPDVTDYIKVIQGHTISCVG